MVEIRYNCDLLQAGHQHRIQNQFQCWEIVHHHESNLVSLGHIKVNSKLQWYSPTFTCQFVFSATRLHVGQILMLFPCGVKTKRVKQPPWRYRVRLQKQLDDALNEPSRGFYMHSWCFSVRSFPPSCPGSVLKDTEERDNQP